MKKKILISGGSGLIGTRLTELLTGAGHSVAHLSRSVQNEGVKKYVWDIGKNTIDPTALVEVDAVIHLAGANVGDKRWTRKRKEDILQSRLQSTRLLFEELKKGRHEVKTFVSSSAIGFYGSGDNETYFTEEDTQGKGFLADVVGKWERAVDEIATLGIRVVKLRGGVVLSERGGALKEMMLPVKLFVGSPLGTGEQMLSWIHLDDFCRIFIKAVDDETMRGVYNAAAPNPVSNKELTLMMAKVLHRPIVLPRVPEFAIKLLFGEMAEIVLEGSKVSCKKIQSTGFEFKFANAYDALVDLLKK